MAAVVALTVTVAPAAPAAGSVTATTSPAEAPAPTAAVPPVATTAAPASTTTSTTLAPPRCDPVAPTAVQFVGTALSRDAAAVRFRVDEVRQGPPIGGTELEVSYVRDTRFFDEGERYLVTAALDPDTALYVSKVRPRRGEDPRCRPLDPIVSTLANGTPIDTGVFTGLHGTRNEVLRAFLLPLGGVLAVLVALVTVKWTFIGVGRGVRRLVRGPARP